MTRIIGIDLGTTNTCASIVEDGQPKIIPSIKGYLTIPSVVAFTPENDLLVGHEAMRQALTNLENTIYGSKRLLGRKYSSRIVQDIKRLFHYQIVEGEAGYVEVLGNSRPFTVPEVSSLILRQIRNVAQEYLKDDDIKAVITVPAYYNERQRMAVKEAGRMADLEVVRTINEPTAAALAYGYRKGADKKLAIYDLGGGTFDVSIMDVSEGVYKVLSTYGDTFLGGVDFDNRIVENVIELLEKQSGEDFPLDRLALQRLKVAAEDAKKELSLREEAEINLPFIATGQDGPVNLSYTLKRKSLERLVEPLVSRTVQICKVALANSRMEVKDIDEVVLVGGQTRMPLVWEKIKNLFGKSPSKGVHPDEVVAVGAAIMADIITRGETGVLLLDVVPMSVGLALPRDRFKKIIPANSQVPIKRTEVFTTSKDNQKSVGITVCQGESSRASENETLQHISFTDLPPGKKGQVKIEVTFHIDTENILTVSARDMKTNKEIKTAVTHKKSPQQEP
jgi:molecular chaperone DnaK